MLKKIAVLLYGPAFGHIIALMLTPYFMSKYNPSYFGEYAFFIAINGILLAFSCFRLDAVLLICEKENSKKIFLLGGGVSITFTMLLFMTALAFEYEHSLSLVFSMLSQSLLLLISSLLLREDRHAVVSFFRFVFTSTIPLAQLLLTFYSFPSALIMGHVMSSLLLILMFIIYFLRFYRWASFGSEIKYFDLLNRYRDYLLINTPSVLLNSCSSQFLPLSIKFLFGESVLGVVNVLQRLFVTPLNFLFRIIIQVYNKELSEFINCSKYIKAKKLFLFTSVFCSMSSIMYCVVLLIVVVLFRERILGNTEWGVYISFLYPFVFLLIIQGLVIPISQSLTFLNAHKQQLIIETYRLVFLFFIFIIFYLVQGKAIMFINFYVALQSMVYVYLFFSIKKLLNLRSD